MLLPLKILHQLLLTFISFSLFTYTILGKSEVVFGMHKDHLHESYGGSCAPAGHQVGGGLISGLYDTYKKKKRKYYYDFGKWKYFSSGDPSFGMISYFWMFVVSLCC